MRFIITQSRGLEKKERPLHIEIQSGNPRVCDRLRGTIPPEFQESDDTIDGLINLVADRIRKYLQVLDLRAGDELHIELKMIDQANQP